MEDMLTPEGISFLLLQTHDPLYQNYLETANYPEKDTNTIKGILYLFKYLRTSKNNDANMAHKFLLKSQGEFTRSDLFQSIIGMSYAFQAKMKTIFGMDDLKKMSEIFENIPEAPEHWLVRFFRGTALYNLGIALPDIFFISESKHKAIETGERDLKWLINANSQLEPESEPIPPEVVTEAKETLKL